LPRKSRQKKQVDLSAKRGALRRTVKIGGEKVRVTEIKRAKLLNNHTWGVRIKSRFRGGRNHNNATGPRQKKGRNTKIGKKTQTSFKRASPNERPHEVGG